MSTKQYWINLSIVLKETSDYKAMLQKWNELTTNFDVFNKKYDYEFTATFYQWNVERDENGNEWGSDTKIIGSFDSVVSKAKQDSSNKESKSISQLEILKLAFLKQREIVDYRQDKAKIYPNSKTAQNNLAREKKKLEEIKEEISNLVDEEQGRK